MTLTFVAVFILRSFQILAITTAFCLANAMRLLISLIQSPPADLYDRRNLKSCTCSNDSPSWSTCTEILSCLLTCHHVFKMPESIYICWLKTGKSEPSLSAYLLNGHFLLQFDCVLLPKMTVSNM